MYKTPQYNKTQIEVNESIEGETLEDKLERIISNQEGIEEGSPSIYTERKDGVLPAYDIRADKWDMALDAMDRAHKQDLLKRQTNIEERQKALEDLNKKSKENTNNSPENTGEVGGAESTVAP